MPPRPPPNATSAMAVSISMRLSSVLAARKRGAASLAYGKKSFAEYEGVGISMESPGYPLVEGEGRLELRLGGRHHPGDGHRHWEASFVGVFVDSMGLLPPESL